MSGKTGRSRAVAREEQSVETRTCPCALDRGTRKAVAVDPGIKTRNLHRLRRIEGQIRGLQRMVEEDRYCADILVQVSSVNEALHAVGRELLRNHLKHCVSASVARGPAEADAMFEELVQLFDRHAT
jgi:CsoR family transcriptional regulator, copper-sensing transcriptional repressor